MMLYSGTTSHMTPCSQNIEDGESCNVQILLANDSAVPAEVKITRNVLWASETGVTKIYPSNTLAAPDLAMSLLSAPALTAKGILILFAPERARVVDAKDKFKVISMEKRCSDEMYYICTNGYVMGYEEDE